MKLASTTSYFEPDAQPAGTVTGVTGFYPPPDPEQMINELQRENAKLRRAVAELESYRKLAYRDALTGLWNRRYFEERLSQEQSLARRKTSRRYSLMVLDLNDLKRINDVEGHAAGDEAIKRAAAFLKTRLREHDVCAGWAATSSPSSCARWGRANAPSWSIACGASWPRPTCAARAASR